MLRCPKHGGKVPTYDPQETIKIWICIIIVGSLLFYAQISAGLVLRQRLSFLLDPTLNTSPKPHLKKKCCRACNYIILGTHDLRVHVKVVSPNYHALNG